MLSIYPPGRNCIEDWINDGQCDDINNSENCTYDGGDCCGNNAVNKYCSDCSCLGTVKPRNSGLLQHQKFFHYYGVFHYFDGSFSRKGHFDHSGVVHYFAGFHYFAVHYYWVLLHHFPEEIKLVIKEC